MNENEIKDNLEKLKYSHKNAWAAYHEACNAYDDARENAKAIVNDALGNRNIARNLMFDASDALNSALTNKKA